MLLIPLCRYLAIGVKYSRSTMFAYRLIQEIVYEVPPTREVCRGTPRCRIPRQRVEQHPLDSHVRSQQPGDKLASGAYLRAPLLVEGAIKGEALGRSPGSENHQRFLVESQGKAE